MQDAVPVYESMPGWSENIEQATAWEELPQAARNYIKRIEELTGMRVSMISVGPDRAQTIML
jgi:adenylosuccinate synthase